jgi:coat protein Gp5
MANTHITPTWVLKETARFWEQNLKFAAHVTRTYDDKFKNGGAKTGYTVYARMPQRFRVTKGEQFQGQNINDQTVPVSITDQAQVSLSWSTADAAMLIEEVQKRYAMPAAAALAGTVENDGLKRMYPFVANSVGTPGTTPSSNLTFLQAGVKLTDLGVPEDGRVAILDSMTAATMANANLSFFHPAPAISRAWRKGQIAGEWMGIDEVFQSSKVAKHTTGTFTASTPLLVGAGQTGSTISTDGWASGASTLKRGDVFTISGVYSVDPITYESTGRLQDFVVTADTSDSSGAMATLPISPSIITSGQFQTVSNSPADDAVITVRGATSATAGTLATTISPQSLVYHPDAFILVMADLDDDLPGASVKRISSKAMNVSFRYVQQYQSMTDQKATRIECLYGWTPFRPDWAVRVWG